MELTPTAQRHASQPTSCGSPAVKSKRSGSSSSRSLGWLTPQARRPTLSTASTSGEESASRSAPAPTIPDAPKRMIFISLVVDLHHHVAQAAVHHLHPVGHTRLDRDHVA